MTINFDYIPLGLSVLGDGEILLGTIEHDFVKGYWFEDNDFVKTSPYFSSEDDCKQFVFEKFNNS